MTTTDKYDIIASDPLDVFVKGTAALYSKEYFEAVKRHLNPGGMFTLYVPLYESDVRTIKSELATFFEAFPYAHGLGEHGRRAGLRHGLHGPAGAAEDQSRRDAAAAGPSGLRAGGAIAARDRRTRSSICSPTMRARRPIWGSGSTARKSTAISICGCSIWAAGESTRRWKIPSTGRC